MIDPSALLSVISRLEVLLTSMEADLDAARAENAELRDALGRPE